MNILKNKSKTYTIACILVLTIAASLMLCLPTAALLPTNVPTIGFMSLRPNPIGINQIVLVNGWTSPHPYMYSTLGLPPDPGKSSTSGIPRYYTITVTTPSNDPFEFEIESDGPGTFWFSYLIDQLGTWTFRFEFEGDEWFNPVAVEETLVCQQDQIPSWPPAEIPTDRPWDYPIIYEDREWYTLSGGWFQEKYNATGCNYNPYSQAPRTAHVLWTLDPVSGMAGLVGGTSGTAVYYSATTPDMEVVMAGRGYGQAGGLIYCIDIRTGEILWTAPGGFDAGAIRNGRPQLYYFSSTFRSYDGLTGELLVECPGALSELGGSQGLGIGFIDPYVLSYQSLGGGVYNYVKWTTEGTSTNFADRVLVNVTWPFAVAPESTSPVGAYGICFDDEILTQIQWPFYSESGSMDIDTGERLWGRVIGYNTPPDYILGITSRGGAGAAYGNMIVPIHGRQICAWNMETGEISWISETLAYPWGNFHAYQFGAAYDMIYRLTYAGLYALNGYDGTVEWYYSAGDAGMETPYAIQAPGESGLETPQTTWPFYNLPAIADGVIFAATGEHSPTAPYLRGQRIHAVDAYTGAGIWSLMGYWDIDSIAEGTLFAGNQYDGRAYAFAKGETATTVSVSSKVISKGSPMLIEGTVLDMSPAQPNTAAISDASMTDWMEYLHMQQPLSMDTTGVSVTLSTIDPNGNYIDIGTATSNTEGNYGFGWTPTIDGTYQIIATFEGSESYYSSYATTHMVVGPAASAAQPIEPEPTTPEPTTPEPTTPEPTTPEPTTPEPTTPEPTTPEPTDPEPTEPAEAPLITTEVALSLIHI